MIGAGSWGSAVARIAAAHGQASLWARDPELAATIDREQIGRAHV